MIKTLGLGAALVLSGTTAFAGGLSEPVATPTVTTPVVAAPPMRPMVDWSGFYAGGQVGTGTLSFDDDLGDEIESDYNSYGLHAGYRYGFGKFVVGGELAYDRLNSDEDDFSDEDIDRVSATLTAGYALGRFLPYVHVGGANLSADSFDDDVNALQYGVGADYMITDSIVVGGRYTRADYNEDDLGFTDDVDVVSDEFQLSVSYQF